MAKVDEKMIDWLYLPLGLLFGYSLSSAYLWGKYVRKIRRDNEKALMKIVEIYEMKISFYEKSRTKQGEDY